MIIDINMHHLPSDLFTNEKVLNGFLTTAPCGFGEIARLGTVESGAKQLILEKPKGCQNLNYVDGDYTLDAKLKAMDENGVDKAILRVPVWQEWLRLETCKLVNDEAAEMSRKSSGRIFNTACVPPWNFKENIDELKRCVNELGAVGVQLACHYGQIYLDDEAFKPFLKVVNDMKLPVIVHHTPLPPYYQSLVDYTNLRRELGRIIDQATAVGRELFSGMFDEFPDLRFTHTMFGGNWFANYNLVTPKKGKKKEAMLRLDMAEGDRVKGYLKNNIFIDMTHPASWGAAQVKCAIEAHGAENVLFGTSFPVFYNWMSDGVAFMKALDIPEADKKKIMSENAIKMFNLPV